SHLTFMFAFLSCLSSACPVLSFYDPLIFHLLLTHYIPSSRISVNPSLFIAKSTTVRLSIPFTASSLKKILRDLHTTSASLLSPIARL
ncbi:hypothetical protein P692DRAFT_20727440, partial [Suillus brevipes Sb2]